MNPEFAKMYPTGGSPSAYKMTPKTITQGTSGTIDLSGVVESMVFISMTASGATAFNITNIQPGMTIIIEQNSTGINNHVITFTGATLNVAGNNTATTNADDEALVIYALTSTRLFVVQNNGAVALSTV